MPKSLDTFIHKLASSHNPLLQQLGGELQQLNQLPPAASLLPQTEEKNFSVDTDLAQGSETESKQKDEIDQMLSTQMPELSKDDAVKNENQARLGTQKVATYRELINARRRKS